MIFRLAAPLLLLAGCAGPFEAVSPRSAAAGEVSLAFCGASETSAGEVIRALDNPPIGEGASSLPAMREVTLCLRAENRGTRPARINPRNLRLKTPHERSPWNTERTDDEFVLQPGESRRFEATFHYPPLLSGERLSVLLDDAVAVNDQRIKTAPIIFRKR